MTNYTLVWGGKDGFRGPTASAKLGFLVFTNVGWLLRKTLGY
jgi:hypothetical protein